MSSKKMTLVKTYAARAAETETALNTDSSIKRYFKVNFTARRMALCGMLMALYIVCCAFSIPVPGGHLYLNDVVICVAGIILDPISAFMVGGVGALLGDLFFYPASMFVSLAVHGLQAIVISVFSHYVMKKHPVIASGIGVTVGGIIMVAGYTLGKIYIYGPGVYGSSEAALASAISKLPYEILQAALGIVLGMLLCWKYHLTRYRSVKK